MSKTIDEYEKNNATEMKRQKAVENAVLTADRIIMEASDGSVEETNYLTSEVAIKFAQKVRQIHISALLKKDLGV